MRRMFFLGVALILIGAAFLACGGGSRNIQPPPTVQTFAFLRDSPGGLFQPMAGNLTGRAFQAIGQPANIWSIAGSRDGKKAVFDMNETGNWDIFVANSDGTHLVQITNDAESDEEPTFSPDGSKVIFTSYRGDRGSFAFDIIVANVDGTGITDLTPNSTMDHRFAVFSPDGTKIAFAGFDPINTVWGIWMMNADGTGLRNVISATNYDGFALPLTFSADGTQIFYSGTTIDPLSVDIHAVNIDGSNSRKLTNTGIDWYPRFNGPTLLFNSLRDGNAEIYRMNLDGTNPQRVTTNTSYDSFSASLYEEPSALIRHANSRHSFPH